jgi:hypothetical protein
MAITITTFFFMKLPTVCKITEWFVILTFLSFERHIQTKARRPQGAPHSACQKCIGSIQTGENSLVHQSGLTACTSVLHFPGANACICGGK